MRDLPAETERQSSAASVGVAGVARRRAYLRSAAAVGLLLLLIGVLWEVAKAIGGDPWRYDSFLGLGFPLHHNPPLRIAQLSDIQLPHLWDIIGALFQPVQRGQSQSLGQFLVGAALYTCLLYTSDAADE